jgi:hypothetical protein
VVLGCFARYETGVDLLLHYRVVVRDLTQLPVAKEIDARIAKMPYDEPLIAKYKHGRSAAHTHLVALGGALLEDSSIGVPKRERYHLKRVGALEIFELLEINRYNFHSHLTRDLAGRVPAHPVRNHKKAAILVGVGKEAILVSFPHATNIGSGGYSKMH